MYELVLEQVRIGLFPLAEHEMFLASFIKEFR